MEKVEQTYKLPEGWIEVHLGEILVLEYGKPLPKNNRIETGKYKVYGSNGIIGNHNISLVDGPVIIVGRKGSVGKVHYEREDCWPIDTTYYIKISQSLDDIFVYYQLLSSNLGALDSSTAIPGINRNQVYNIKAKLPPLREQRRIVSKIETLFSELDHAEKNLINAKQQLEAYRQSLLKKAFNGKLSKKWRDENLEEFKKSENKLPANWKYKKITSLSDFVGSGSTPRGGRNIYIEGGIPFIRSQNVLVNRLIEDDLVFISSEIHEKMKRTHTKPKDVLLNITGASIGRCAYIHEGFSEGNVNQHVCIIRANHKIIDYKYLTFFLNSPEAQIRIKQINTGATREALTLSQIKAFEIPVCDTREQNVITQTLESQFTLIDNLNDTINKSIEEVVSLRLSILKKAFDGKLVNQEPTDEPVQKLLELIQKERIEYLKSQKETLLQKPKRILQMDSNKTVWQILSTSKIAMRTDKLWSESKHKDDIDAFYAEVKELIDSGKIVEDKRQGKVSYLKVK